LIEQVDAALRELPEMTRDVFVLHRFKDLGYDRIAHRLGIGVADVERHMAEAIYRLVHRLRLPHDGHRATER
jgi:RNA polymerase sigma-70 factor (ECF subfamily)